MRQRIDNRGMTTAEAIEAALERAEIEPLNTKASRARMRAAITDVAKAAEDEGAALRAIIERAADATDWKSRVDALNEAIVAIGRKP